MSEHSEISPSGIAAVLACPGKVAAERGLPDESSSYADEGTAAHWVAAEILHGRLVHRGDVAPNGVAVSDDMLDAVDVYVARILEASSVARHPPLIEQRVDLATWIPSGFGTSDALIPNGDELQVHDYKHGRGVPVYADRNAQLMTYALGGLELLELTHTFATVRLVIHQPRISNYSEWSCSVEELLAFGEEIKAACARALAPDAPRIPGDAQCKFCRVKATCPELAAFVQRKTDVMFDDLDREAPLVNVLHAHSLADAMHAVDLVEQWCKAVRAETERRLLAGAAVPGWKLVTGRKPARAWADADAAEQTLRAMRLPVDEMYEKSLRSPTAIEKVLKDRPRTWRKVEPLIAQREASLSVAPASDKRPAVVVEPVALKFDDLTTQEN